MFSLNQEKDVLGALQTYTSFLNAQFICSAFNLFAGRTVAVVAGGCIRSVMTGKPVKDIDIVIERTYKDEEELRILADRLGYQVRYLSDPAYAECLTCVVVLQLLKQGKLPIEVIMVDCSIEDRIKAHSASCSNVWLDGNTLKYTHDYVEFIQNKVIKHYTESPQFSDDYLRRMVEYYPDYNHVRV